MSPSKPPVVLVDDEPDIREVLAELLREQGHEVLEAENGLDALKTLEGVARPCVLVLDLMMPVMDGIQVLTELKARGDEELLRHVVVASADRTAPQQVAPFGIKALLVKPFSLFEFVRLVDQTCLA